MVKVQFSDVVPPDKRSIRNIPIPKGGKRKTPIVIKPEIPESEYNKKESYVSAPDFQPRETIREIPKDIKNTPAYEYYYPNNKKEPEKTFEPNLKSNKKSFIFGAIIFVAIAAFIVTMMTVFASATVAITPKSQVIDVSMGIEATGEGDPAGVKYEVMKLSRVETVSALATGEEAVEIKASGKIVVYNDFSSESQRLIVRTRFETPEGLIYRIPESIIVPGRSVKNGVSTPGSVEVEVFADEAGEKYNIKKTDFTIPGFKNDAARYKGFYARSLTEMSGGFVGKRKTVSSSEKDAALKSIGSGSEAMLEKDLRAKVPEGLTLLLNSVIYESRELPPKDDSSGVILSKEVTAYVIVLSTKDLSEKITQKYVTNYPDWDNIQASIHDFSLLSIAEKPQKIEAGQKMVLQLEGKAKLVADINSELVKEKLVGIERKSIMQLLNEFKGISSLKVTIRPIWKKSFPDNPLKINIKTTTAN